MKISEKWLRESVNTETPLNKLCDQLTMAGLEIESVEPVCQFTHVYVGEVIETEKHPDADKLTVCKVSVGKDEPLQIICGAPNVRHGLKVACAVVGAELPGIKIKKAKLRGVVSEGMLCSSVELKLEDTSDGGIMELPSDAPVGESFESYMQLDDHVIDISITPNRGDCISVLGIAREVAAIEGVKCLLDMDPAVKPRDDSGNLDTRTIHLEAKEACPKYVGRIIKGVNNNVETPRWMKERLRRSDIRSISPVVDVGNYVMLECGQPMHAFDLSKFKGDIHVRLANPKEAIGLLNEETKTLTPDTLVIADDKETQAIAGVMGAESAAVTHETTDILLESAFFTPRYIAHTARALGVSSDSAYRFERGVDPALQHYAIERATKLLLDIVGGKAGPMIDAVEETALPVNPWILLRRSRLLQLLGFSIEDKKCEAILTHLNMMIKPHQEGWEVQAPSYRFDIHIEADLIEEMARLYGYDHIPEAAPKISMATSNKAYGSISTKSYRDLLMHLGYQEAITYSFVDQAIQEKLLPHTKAIPLLNPISQDLNVMRTSLWTGLIAALKYNQHRQQQRVWLYEYGLVFEKEEGSTPEGRLDQAVKPRDENAESNIKQQLSLAGLISGSFYKPQWGAKDRAIDFYDIKQHVISLCALRVAPDAIRFEASEHPALHPGQSARVYYQGKAIGWAGMLHPECLQSLHLKGPVALFELSLGALPLEKNIQTEAISKFPEIRRDLALLIDADISADALIKASLKSKPAFVKDVQLFDFYQGEGIPDGKKSVAISLTLQHKERTLVDEEVAASVQKVVNSLKSELNAELRE